MDFNEILLNIFVLTSDFVKFYMLKNPMAQNFSPNQNYFFDEEVITVYLFGLHRKLHNTKEIHSFIKDYHKQDFPKLPEYESFNYRLNKLSYMFNELFNFLMSNFSKNTDLKELILVVDSMPIVLSKKTKKKEKMISKSFANNGYCSSKDLHYYGVKLHAVLVAQVQTLATPFFIKVNKASEHDLTAIKPHYKEFKDCTFVGDKAYISGDLKEKLNKMNSMLVTPIKLSKFKKEYTETEKLYNKLVSSRRQCVEIFFSWINQITKISVGSKIRSYSGLIFFIYSRLAFCLILLNLLKI